jgi:two-component system phosphate regulon response regulator PhoB
MDCSILVVDPEAALRGQLAGNLESAGYRVQCARDVREAEAITRELQPDLVLLDWMLPGIPGLTFARRLRADQRTAAVSIIVLSACAEECECVAALGCGADDFVAKPISNRVLLARIKAVLRRRAPQLSEETVAIAGRRLDPAARSATAGGRDVELSSTEFRLLHFFMTHPGRTFTRSQLLDEAWGDRPFVEERSVDVRISRLRLALAATGHEALIETVRGTGYRLRAEAAAPEHATVTDVARLRALSTPLPRASAA